MSKTVVERIYKTRRQYYYDSAYLCANFKFASTKLALETVLGIFINHLSLGNKNVIESDWILRTKKTANK